MRQDAANNRDAIVAATRQLLVTEGPGVSMRTIAKTASVGVATATRHFPERIDLLEAVSAQAVGDIAAVIEEHLDRFDTDPRTAWRTTVHAIGELQLAALAQERRRRGHPTTGYSAAPRRQTSAPPILTLWSST